MQKIPRKPRLRGVPRIAFAAALTALTLWTVGVAATAHSLSDAAERLRQETALPLALLRYEMGGEEADELSLMLSTRGKQGMIYSQLARVKARSPLDG